MKSLHSYFIITRKHFYFLKYRVDHTTAVVGIPNKPFKSLFLDICRKLSHD